MRLAYLINQYPKVSHSFIRREILALERQGFEVVRIAIRGWNNDLVDEADNLERTKTRYVLQAGWTAIAFAVLATAITRPAHFARAAGLTASVSRQAERPFPYHLAYLAEACFIQRWLTQFKVRHVHAHFGTNSAEVAMLVRTLGGPPFSFTTHGPEEFDKASLLGLAEKIRRAAFVVAVSSFGRSQLFRLVGPEHWSKIHVVHCGLEQAYFEAASEYCETRNLVCVGRLCEQKGQLLLIEAARCLAEANVDFTLTLAGDGELRGEIESLIAKHGLGEKIRITGWISSDEVRWQLTQARALVLPSFAEGLPVVIMEAMALRRPVISTYIAGIPELVEDGKHGWLVPAGDVEALASAMRQCLESEPTRLKGMGDAAHERVIRRHHVDMEVAKFSGLIAAQNNEREAT